MLSFPTVSLTSVPEIYYRFEMPAYYMSANSAPAKIARAQYRKFEHHDAGIVN